MTPADLAELLRATATDVLTTRGLDTAVLPRTMTVERPRNPDHGDYASNVALQVAKRAGVSPRDFAGWLASELADADGVSGAEVAGPGFLNIRLSPAAQGEVITRIVDEGSAYGHGVAMAGTRVNLEFVSNNPTGPIHLGATRWAAVGDALARIMSAQGADVAREYYFNDHGAQIDRFVRSLLAAAQEQPTPEDGYAGEYIGEIAQRVVVDHPGVLELPDAQRHETFRAAGVDMMFTEIKSRLHEFGVDFDVYFHENALFASGAVEKAVIELKASDKLYFADGAWWLRSTEYGDDKDRVVIKSDGDAAYIAGDIAYLRDKRGRGFDLCIIMLGADHHGYVARLKAAAAALGDDPRVVEVLIGQMVNLVRNGVPVRMSKRNGTIVTLEDFVDAVGVDAARYALLRSSVDSSIDIDLDLLAKKSNDNPVYYVQYAHARLSALARSAADLGISATSTQLDLLSHEREGQLMRTLGAYSTVLASASELREPHRVARYLEALAGDYHRFYDSCRVLPMGNEEAGPLHGARLALCGATRQVLAAGLGVLGVSAPERM